MPELELGDWKNQDAMGRWVIWQKLWASMLFPGKTKPDNPSLRKDYIVTAVASHLTNSQQTGNLKVQEVGPWISKYLDPIGGIKDLVLARSLEEITKKASQSYREGVIAGYQLFQVATLSKILPKHTDDKKLNASKGIAALLASEGFKDSDFEVTRFSAENYWDKMKPSIHLWAALYVILQTTDDLVPFDDFHEFFPFGFENLPVFLSLAEKFRVFGLKYCPRDKKKPLLTENEVYSIPNGFPFAIMKMSWGKMSGVEETIEFIKKEYESNIDPEYLKKKS